MTENGRFLPTVFFNYGHKHYTVHLTDDVDAKSCQTFEEVKSLVENYIYYYKRSQLNLNKMTPAQMFSCRFLLAQYLMKHTENTSRQLRENRQIFVTIQILILQFLLWIAAVGLCPPSQIQRDVFLPVFIGTIFNETR